MEERGLEVAAVEEKGGSSQSDYDEEEEEEISDGGNGYVPLSEEEEGEALTRETSEEPRFDEEMEGEEVASGQDPLGDVFPSDEQEWNQLRASREDDEVEQQGLGIRSSRGGRDSLLLTGGELSRGLDESADDFEDADLDREEIEDLLARHPPTPGFGALSGESSPTSPQDLSSTPSTRRNTTSSRPSRLTLASPISLDIPPNSFLPVLTTSPTASEANSQLRGAPGHPDDTLLSPLSEFSGGLAYLREGSVNDSRFGGSSHDSIDAGMSAALHGAFGVGEHGEMLNDEEGNRGSAFLMHESLNDLEKGSSLSSPSASLPTSDMLTSFFSYIFLLLQLFDPSHLETSESPTEIDPTTRHPTRTFRLTRSPFFLLLRTLDLRRLPTLESSLERSRRIAHPLFLRLSSEETSTRPSETRLFSLLRVRS